MLAAVERDGRGEPFEIFRRLIHSKATAAAAEAMAKRSVQFRQDDPVAGIFCVCACIVGPQSGHDSCQLVPREREICRRNYDSGQLKSPSSYFLTFSRSHVPLSIRVSDTSVRIQRGTVSQHERGAAQESRTRRDFVDGAGE